MKDVSFWLSLMWATVDLRASLQPSECDDKLGEDDVYHVYKFHL